MEKDYTIRDDVDINEFEHIKHYIDIIKTKFVMTGGAIDFDLTGDIEAIIDNMIETYNYEVMSILCYIPELYNITSTKLKTLVESVITILNETDIDDPTYILADGTYLLDFINNKLQIFNEIMTDHIPNLLRSLGDIYGNALSMHNILNKIIGIINEKYALYVSEKRNIHNEIEINNVPFVKIPNMPDITEKRLVNVMSNYVDITKQYTKVFKEYYPKNIQDKLPEYIIVKDNNKVKPSIGYINYKIIRTDPINEIDIFKPDINKYIISNKDFTYDFWDPNIEGKYGQVPPITNNWTIPILGEMLDYHLFMTKSKINAKLQDLLLPESDRYTYTKIYKDEIKEILGSDDKDNVIFKSSLTGILNKLYEDGIAELAKYGAVKLLKYINGKYNRPKKPVWFPFDKGDPRMNLDEINSKINDIIDHKIINSDVSSIMQLVNVFNNNNTDSESNKIQHVIKNHTDNKDKKCYDIEPDTLQQLINAGANMNIKDNSGRTPIFYAIDLKNRELINVLLESRVSTYSDRAIDLTGNTPYLYSRKKLEEYVTPKNIQDMFDTENKKIIEEIKKDSNYRGIMMHTDIIMRWVLYLVNHQLTELELKAQSQSNIENTDLWTYTDHKKLADNLQINKQLHFLSLEKSGDKKDTTHLNEGQIIKYNNMVKKLENRINILNNSLREIKNELVDIIYPVRRVHLDKLKIITEKEKNDAENDLNKLKDSLEKIKMNKSITEREMSPEYKFMTHVVKNIKFEKYEESFEIINIYDAIFKELSKSVPDEYIANNYAVYSKRWHELLKNTNETYKKDGTQLPLIALEHITNPSLQNANSNYDCGIYCKYMSSVIIPHIEDYFLLPRNYKRHNYLLDAFVNIYVHVIRHTICENYNALLMKYTLQYLIKISPQDKKKNINILKNIYKRSIIPYIMGKMPDLIVRNILGIHTHDKEESATTNVTELLKKAAIMITDNSNGLISSDDKDKFLQDIYKFMIPYIENHCRKFVEAMNKNVEMYLMILRSIQNDVDIFSKISTHSLKEMQSNN